LEIALNPDRLGDVVRDMGAARVDEQLLGALFSAHAPALLSYALRLTGGDRGRAEDVVQETLLRAWRHPESLDPKRGDPRPWLFTVARRIAIDRYRRASCAGRTAGRGGRRRAGVGGVEHR